MSKRPGEGWQDAAMGLYDICDRFEVTAFLVREGLWDGHWDATSAVEVSRLCSLLLKHHVEIMAELADRGGEFRHCIGEWEHCHVRPWAGGLPLSLGTRGTAAPGQPSPEHIAQRDLLRVATTFGAA